MENAVLFETLKQISQKLEKNKIDWVLGGSLCLLLHGIKTTPHDIDIQTRKKDAYKIMDLYKEFQVAPIKFGTCGNVRSHRGLFVINNTNIDVVGDLEFYYGGKWENFSEKRLKNKILTNMKGVIVPLAPLETLRESYTALGREGDKEKVRLIEERMSLKKS